MAADIKINLQLHGDLETDFRVTGIIQGSGEDLEQAMMLATGVNFMLDHLDLSLETFLLLLTAEKQTSKDGYTATVRLPKKDGGDKV